MTDARENTEALAERRLEARGEGLVVHVQHTLRLVGRQHPDEGCPVIRNRQHGDGPGFRKSLESAILGCFAGKEVADDRPLFVVHPGCTDTDHLAH